MSGKVAVAARFGLHNAEAIATAADLAGLPFPVACALIEKESMGRNIYGHDAGGAGPHGQPVTATNFRVFLDKVLRGETSNGVGPAQITWAGSRRADGTRDGGFFTAMRDRGLRPWVPVDNMRFGFELLVGYHRATGSWVGAGERYNGARAYGEDLARKIEVWRERLGPLAEGGRPPEIRIGTANLSHAAATKRPEKLEDDLTAFIEELDVVLVQEAGAAKGIVLAAARRAGATVWLGERRPGQASTPIIVRGGIKVRFVAAPLTAGGRWIGQGAGPSRSKAKWVMIALFELDGEKYAVGNVHLVPSQHFGLRRITALLQTRRAAAALKRHGEGRHRILGGDLNNVPGARTLVPLVTSGLRSVQQRLGELATKGKRPIDDIYTDAELRPVEHEAVDTVSDHHWFSALLRVRPRFRD